jgi:hypothetical protein
MTIISKEEEREGERGGQPKTVRLTTDRKRSEGLNVAVDVETVTTFSAVYNWLRISSVSITNVYRPTFLKYFY